MEYPKGTQCLWKQIRSDLTIFQSNAKEKVPVLLVDKGYPFHLHVQRKTCNVLSPIHCIRWREIYIFLDKHRLSCTAKNILLKEGKTNNNHSPTYSIKLTASLSGRRPACSIASAAFHRSSRPSNSEQGLTWKLHCSTPKYKNNAPHNVVSSMHEESLSSCSCESVYNKHEAVNYVLGLSAVCQP